MTEKTTIKHIAMLSKLEIKDEELDALTSKLSSILDYANKLQELDTENVEITYNPLTITNMFREDNCGQSLDRKDALLNAPDKEMGCFKVPKVLG